VWIHQENDDDEKQDERLRQKYMYVMSFVRDRLTSDVENKLNWWPLPLCGGHSVGSAVSVLSSLFVMFCLRSGAVELSCFV